MCKTALILDVSLCLILPPSAQTCLSCCSGDGSCRWRQQPTWHPGSEFSRPPGKNSGVFLSLFPSPFSLSPLKCVTLIFHLPAPPLTTTAPLSLSSCPATSVIHTSTHTHTPQVTFDTCKSVASLHTNEDRLLCSLSVLTPRCLRRASPACTGRRSTPAPRDGARLPMPSERVERHTHVQHL